VWGNGCIDPHFLDFGTKLEISGQLHVPAALTPGKEPLVPIGKECWIGPRTGLDDVLTLPGLELRSIGHPASSQSLYGLRYRNIKIVEDRKRKKITKERKEERGIKI
jgi:hypothetical protein